MYGMGGIEIEKKATNIENFMVTALSMEKDEKKVK